MPNIVHGDTKPSPIMGIGIASRNSLATAAKALSAISFTAWLFPFSILMTALDLDSATAIATNSQKLVTI
jgi:hypothetical protein